LAPEEAGALLAVLTSTLYSITAEMAPLGDLAETVREAVIRAVRVIILPQRLFA
jgi:hypothetical protein